MICFVVLHYQNLDVTQKCVNFLLKLNGENKHIIIVDNGSPNGTGKILEEKYVLDSNITVILSQDIVMPKK